MEELLNDPEFQKLAEFMPYLVAIGVAQIVLWLLLGNTIRMTLNLVKKENRMMAPGQALLMAIPLFNIYWNFMVVRHLRDSLNNEFFDRQVAVEENPTQREGNLYAWSYLARNFPLPSYILFAAMFLNIAGFIMYWIKVAQYKKLLKSTQDLAISDEEFINS